MRRFIALLVLIAPIYAIGQQDVQWTQFMYNRLYYNPAVAGSGGAICINGMHRSQWVGFTGAPVTQNINANIPIRQLGGGIGVSIVNDQIGFFQSISFDLMYAYQFQLSDGTLGVGIGASFLNKSLSDAAWIPADFNPQNPTGPINDFALAGANANGFQIDATFGAYYQNETWWAGVSSNRVIESRVLVDNYAGSGSSAAFKNARHYYVMGGYNWAIPGTNWELQPSTIFKLSSGSAYTADMNVTGVYNKKLWGGVTYRLNDAVAAILGYQFTPSFRAGYSYDIGTSAVAGASGGSHEIMAQYCFKIEIPPTPKGRYRNPRFL